MTDEESSDFGELRDRVGRLEQGLSENTEATKRIESGVGELIELMRFARGGVRVLTWLGRGIKNLVMWCRPFLIAWGAIYALTHHGKWPDFIDFK
jgi:hypothetical protein